MLIFLNSEQRRYYINVDQLKQEQVNTSNIHKFKLIEQLIKLIEKGNDKEIIKFLIESEIFPREHLYELFTLSIDNTEYNYA